MVTRALTPGIIMSMLSFRMNRDMNYWIIDVSAGCPWGYSFCVKAKTEDDDRGKVIEGAAKAGLFNYDYDQYGCACHLIGYDAQVSLEDWADDAVEIEL